MQEYKTAIVAIGRILDEGIGWYRSHWIPLFPAALMAMLLLRVPHFLNTYFATLGTTTLSASIVFLLTGLLFLLLGIVFVLTIFVQVEAVRRNKWVGLVKAARYSCTKLPQVVLAALLYAAILLLILTLSVIATVGIPIPMVLRIILGTTFLLLFVYFCIRLSLFIPAILVDKNGVLSSLAYSAQLISCITKWLMVTVVITMAQILASILVLLPSTLIGLLLALTAGESTALLADTMNNAHIDEWTFWFREIWVILLSGIVSPIICAGILAMYHYLQDHQGITLISDTGDTGDTRPTT